MEISEMPIEELVSPSIFQSDSNTIEKKSPAEKVLAKSRIPLKDIESLIYESSGNIAVPSNIPTPSKLMKKSNSWMASSIENDLHEVNLGKKSLLLGTNAKLEINHVSSFFIASDDQQTLLLNEDLASKYRDFAAKLECEKQELITENESLKSSQKMLESRLNTALEQIQTKDLEVDELKSLLTDQSKNNVLNEALNNLQSRYDASKTDAANVSIFSQKLQSEISTMKRKVAQLEENLDNRNDAFEMAIVDKCVAEENLELMKNEIKILRSHIEELSLELELSSASEVTHLKTAPDSHELALLNEKLMAALIKYFILL
jgi:hypothetical protein